MFAVSILGIILNACNNNAGKQRELDAQKNEHTVIDGHNSQNSLDWVGVYEGTLPCADCEGIKTTIELNSDLTYIKKEEYLENKNKKNKFEENGKFEWNTTGSVIILNNSKKRRQYKVGENKIIHLDNDGQEIPGDLSEMYVLKKK